MIEKDEGNKKKRAYHRRPGSDRPGPKGPWKAKGEVLDLVIKLNEESPWLSGESLAKEVERKTGTVLSDRRINQIRHGMGEKSWTLRGRQVAPARGIRASPSS